mgnify:CR=1 FL=1
MVCRHCSAHSAAGCGLAQGKAVVAAKGSEDLLAEVNTVINQVVNDGSYLKAYDEAVELAASMGL